VKRVQQRSIAVHRCVHCDRQVLQKEEEARENDKREKEKKEQSLKERLQKEADEGNKRREKAAHSDALANYLTLLNEVVKDPEATWSEWKLRLQKDPQVSALCSLLSPPSPIPGIHLVGCVFLKRSFSRLVEISSGFRDVSSVHAVCQTRHLRRRLLQTASAIAHLPLRSHICSKCLWPNLGEMIRGQVSPSRPQVSGVPPRNSKRPGPSDTNTVAREAA
jgi:hypothetical protein